MNKTIVTQERGKVLPMQRLYMEEIKIQTRKTGFTETFFGRKRYFEGINSKIPFIRASAERMAINAPIQGTEADMVKIAMINIFEFLQKEKLSDQAKLILQVHDELVYEVDLDQAEKLEGKIKELMENVLPLTKTSGVPILATSVICNNLADAK